MSEHIFTPNAALPRPNVRLSNAPAANSETPIRQRSYSSPLGSIRLTGSPST